MYSIGVIVNADGAVLDVNPDLAAAKAGLAPGMKITKVNGNVFSVENLSGAVAKSSNAGSVIKIEAENGSVSAGFELSYHGGHRYPHLVRDDTKPDLLSDIVKPR